MRRPVGDVAGLVNRQRIHIRPQSNRRTITGTKHANQTGLANVAMKFAAEFGTPNLTVDLRAKCADRN
jgi:hypothetical protein